jgi:arabinofuranosyltransferase
LLKSLQRGRPYPSRTQALEGLALRERAPTVVVAQAIGLLGYFAGPNVHIVDQLALADPLLARLPSDSPVIAMVGHIPRRIPDGYLETIRTSRNQFADRELAEYYDRLHLITSGPLWDRRRLATIVPFLMGRYDYLRTNYIETYVLGRRKPPRRPAGR